MLAGKVNFVSPFSQKKSPNSNHELGDIPFLSTNFQSTPLSTKVLYIYVTDRSSGSRIILLAAPSLPAFSQEVAIRVRTEISSHFKRWCIPLGCVAKARNILIFLRFRALPDVRLNTQNCELISVRTLIAAFVPDYSGGPAPDLHGIPY